MLKLSPQPQASLTLGLLNLKAFVQSFPGIVKLSAIQIEEALGIDEDLDALRLEHQVLRLGLIRKLQGVGHPRATRGTYPQADTQALPTIFQVAAHMIGGGRSHRNPHVRYSPDRHAATAALQNSARGGDGISHPTPGLAVKPIRPASARNRESRP
jgi:hypothetical protein